MRKAHFGAVHGAVARGLDHGEDIVILGIERDALEGCLEDSLEISCVSVRWDGTGRTLSCSNLSMAGLRREGPSLFFCRETPEMCCRFRFCCCCFALYPL